MNRLHLLLSAVCLCFSISAFSQLKYTVKEMPDAYTYGVYVKPCGDLMPSANTITGTAQVTIVLPLGNNVTELAPTAGVWVDGGTVSGPVEAPNNNYFFFGFLSDDPQIQYSTEEATLLFTFKVEGTAEPELFRNGEDPFGIFPNSMNSNPGNEISVIDVGVSPVGYYYYDGNYSDDDPESCNTDEDGNNGNTTATKESIETDKLFSLSPNPTSSIINVEFSDARAYEEGTIKVYSAQGISIGNLKRSGQSKVNFNVRSLPAGFYFVSFESDGKVLQRERFMKQ